MDEKKQLDDSKDAGVTPHEGSDFGEGDATQFGYKQEMQRNRGMVHLLFQSLAIAAIPYGEGSALISSIYGGGQLSLFVGWIVVCILDQFVAVSLAELASRWPTSGGPSYWTFQAAPKAKSFLAYITGWVWLIGNWTITLSVNFGMAKLLSGTISMYHPDFNLNNWQVVLVFWLLTLVTLVVCIVGNKYLPKVDLICAAWTAVTIIIILISLSVVAGAGRRSASVALGQYNEEFSGWGGFTFFIGLLPAAYTFSAIGMISAMAEEVADPAIKVPRAISWAIPVGFLWGLLFILPICFTMPPLDEVINAPSGQALPFIFNAVMASPGGGLALMFFVLVLTLFCSISITVAASRCTWAFARDDAIPGAKFFAKINQKFQVPVNALLLVTVVQMLLGLINIGSQVAFTAFISVGVQALALSYGIPIGISLFTGRTEVNKARWHLNNTVGTVCNVMALLWIAFEQVLFSMPSALPVTPPTMNYSSVLLYGLGAIAMFWYIIHSRKSESDPHEADARKEANANTAYVGPPAFD